MAEDRGRLWWQRLLSQVWVRAITGAAAFVLVWWLVPPLLYAHARVSTEDARLKAITDTRTALLAGLVGLGALGTFWLNSRIHRITARTFEVTERGHVTDRYSKAIEQLGSDSLDVRLGGIYALEQIAKDSARAKEDQATVVEVLSAFGRVHSDPVYRYKAETPFDLPFTSDQKEETVRIANDYVTKAAKLPVDVQAAITVLGRLPYTEKVPRGDLTGAKLRYIALVHTDLSGAILIEADLTGANLREADLSRADLSRADLTGANLTGADLTGAHLTEAILHKADLTGADLTEAHLDQADLTGANLTGADLTGADLRWTILTRAILYKANLTGADLRRANLMETHFLETKLTGANLYRANLREANLSRADLTDANLNQAALNQADLTGADLTEAHLHKADLTGAILTGWAVDGELSVRGLTQAQLGLAGGDHETQLPANLSRPEHWDTQ